LANQGQLTGLLLLGRLLHSGCPEGWLVTRAVVNAGVMTPASNPEAALPSLDSAHTDTRQAEREVQIHEQRCHGIRFDPSIEVARSVRGLVMKGAKT